MADIFVSMRPKYVLIGGGEPLLVPELFEIIGRLKKGDLAVWVYTNGLELTEGVAERLAEVGAQVNVSLDGCTAEVHDSIRGRLGAFGAAMAALGACDRVAAGRKIRGVTPLRFGFDVVLVQSNFRQIEDFCTVLAPTLPQLTFMQFGAVIPSGLATRPSFAKHELLTTEQLNQLGDPLFETRLRALAPRSVEFVTVVDNLFLQFHSQQAQQPSTLLQSGAMEIEPDGGVRAIETYEGTVGNILRDAPEVLWRRCRERSNDPLFVNLLTAVKTSEDWAAAVRKLDERFADERELVRLRRRPELVPGQPATSSAQRQADG